MQRPGPPHGAAGFSRQQEGNTGPRIEYSTALDFFPLWFFYLLKWELRFRGQLAGVSGSHHRATYANRLGLRGFWGVQSAKISPSALARGIFGLV